MKKIIAVLLALTMLLVLFAGCKKEEVSQPAELVTRQVAQVKYHEAAGSFAGGTGTAEDPYQISTVKELVYLGAVLESDSSNYGDKCYILTADISLNDVSGFENWGTTAPEYGWKPLGETNTFGGTFDGNGHKITGMFIDADGNSTEDAYDYYGLFSNLRGTVKNLTVEQSFMRISGATSSVGTFAGNSHNGTVENCSSDAVIELIKAENAGGIAGRGNGNITNCTYSGTITETDATSFANIGGIVGNGGNIDGCTFTGTLSGGTYTGGITGWGEIVKNSVNKGDVNGDTAGGICGRIYNANVGTEIENPHQSFENCTNEGKVTGVALAGGIVGWMGNGEPDISISVTNCENKGQVICDTIVAGVIGKLDVENTGNIKIENCINRSDISGKGTVGGIICDVAGAILNQKGDVTVSGCHNFGNITSEGLYSAGIITYFMVMGGETDLRLTVEKCTNDGAIQSSSCAGGILGFSNVSFNAETTSTVNISGNTKVSLRNCNNNGKITTTTSNSVAGGIVGNLGLGYISTDITNCTNTGAVSVEFTLTDEQIAEQQGSEWTEIYQICGGIVGRIGDGIKLTTAEGIEKSENNVNTSSGNINISGCQSTGTITASDYSFVLNKWEQPLYVNYLGGIVGQCSATNGYAFGVENCTYSNAERGLGSTDYADIGTKR